MPRKFIILLIVIVVLVVGSIVAVILVQRSPGLQNSVLRLANQQTNTNQAPPIVINVNIPVVNSPEEDAIRFVARNFAERYGSGSSTNNFQNVVEAQAWGTPGFNTFLNRQIAQDRQKPKPKTFQRVITRAFVMNITSRQAARAAVTVTTQREETIDQAVTTYYQELLLNLIKGSNGWKIDAATWRSR